MFFKRAKQDKKKSKKAEPEAAEDAVKAAAGEAADGAEASVSASPPHASPSHAGPTDPKSLGFETTAELDILDSPIGHKKALEAIAFGAGMKGPGYNILVTGSDEAECLAAVRAKLDEVAGKGEWPTDWAYVSSFDTSDHYRAIELPAGTAKTFAEKMAHALDCLADALPAAFAADDYDLKRRTIEEEFRFSREDALETLRQEAEAQNIALLRTPAGIAVAPILDGKVVKSDVFNSVPESLRREVQTKITALEAEIEAILAERPDAEKERRARLLALNEQVAGRHVRAVLEDVQAEFSDVVGTKSFLKAAGRDLVRNAGLFLSAAVHASVHIPVGTIGDARFARYRVHVMGLTAGAGGAPVVHEPNPTYANLFGRVELGAGAEGQPSQLTRIKPGALHRANGGLLILDARALLAVPAVRDALARALEAEEIRFDPPADPVGSAATEIPDLEPIPLSVRVVVVGDAAAQRRLAEEAPQLKRHFKVEAVFDEAVRRSPEAVAAFARLIAGIVVRNELKPVDAEGVAKLIDEAGRAAGGNGELSLEISNIADICREADHWAGGAGRLVTSVADIERALEARTERAPQASVGSAA
jgi:predicted ATP-dependent protease